MKTATDCCRTLLLSEAQTKKTTMYKRNLLRAMYLQYGRQRSVVGVWKLVGKSSCDRVLGYRAPSGHRRLSHHGRYAGHESVQVKSLGVRGGMLTRRREDEPRGEVGQLINWRHWRRETVEALWRKLGESDGVYLADPRLNNERRTAEQQVQVNALGGDRSLYNSCHADINVTTASNALSRRRHWVRRWLTNGASL